ncbi:unnamed protein product [Bursaphelenchus xylophilus]|uniref:(pine wood nematode) hypothetical protein n=1 Tax=Bursaphelenchus xylophilus TaxID=6326 RepID=A0A1I7RRV8_BURXY|nr:unnamed protein product [Bursaphelenchus xylophilus]CAG9123444.1 unnamed protein product [Bursaphelenchus xylophilus]
MKKKDNTETTMSEEMESGCVAGLARVYSPAPKRCVLPGLLWTGSHLDLERAPEGTEGFCANSRLPSMVAAGIEDKQPSYLSRPAASSGNSARFFAPPAGKP